MLQAAYRSGELPIVFSCNDAAVTFRALTLKWGILIPL